MKSYNNPKAHQIHQQQFTTRTLNSFPSQLHSSHPLTAALLRVDAVVKTSAAAECGLKVEDVIVEIDGWNVEKLNAEERTREDLLNSLIQHLQQWNNETPPLSIVVLRRVNADCFHRSAADLQVRQCAHLPRYRTVEQGKVMHCARSGCCCVDSSLDCSQSEYECYERIATVVNPRHEVHNINQRRQFNQQPKWGMGCVLSIPRFHVVKDKRFVNQHTDAKTKTDADADCSSSAAATTQQPFNGSPLKN